MFLTATVAIAVPQAVVTTQINVIGPFLNGNCVERIAECTGGSVRDGANSPAPVE